MRACLWRRPKNLRRRRETVNPVFGRYSVHTRSDGGAYVLDTRKAPYWTIAHGLAFVGHARAPRRTIVFGTISDYSGSVSPRYRRVAREALEVAERVVFVGPNSAYVDRLRQGELRYRLFAFHTAYQANAFLSGEPTPGELIYVKASGTDHLERLMWAEIDQVICWRERCGKSYACHECAKYRVRSAPPFGVEPATAPISVEGPD
jgi:UDP-N-acetylmuramoyl-tripeptide--D-alanyl-D-alanine ligase